MGTKTEIIAKAIEILEAIPGGLRYSDLVKKIHEEWQEIPVNTIRDLCKSTASVTLK